MCMWTSTSLRTEAEICLHELNYAFKCGILEKDTKMLEILLERQSWSLTVYPDTYEASEEILLCL